MTLYSSFSRRIQFYKFLPKTGDLKSAVTSFDQTVGPHTRNKRHSDRKSLFSSAMQSIPDAPSSENMMIVLTNDNTVNY